MYTSRQRPCCLIKLYNHILALFTRNLKTPSLPCVHKKWAAQNKFYNQQLFRPFIFAVTEWGGNTGTLFIATLQVEGEARTPPDFSVYFQGPPAAAVLLPSKLTFWLSITQLKEGEPSEETDFKASIPISPTPGKAPKTISHA